MVSRQVETRAVGRRWTLLAIILTLLSVIPSLPASVEALGEYLSCHDCTYDTVRLNCPGAVMKKAPTFASNPPGFASYPFEEGCPVSRQAGQYQNGVIHLYFEGRWNPSETRQDRPNAVETLFIEDYEQFFPNRQMKGPGERRIFVYWTARCTKDPWLQGGTCQRLGEYVPNDVGEAFPAVIKYKPFPLTGNSMSAKLKQQLIKQYQEVNQPGGAQLKTQQGLQNMVIQSPQSQIAITQSQSQRLQDITVQSQGGLPKPSAGALARSGVFARGIEEKEAQPSDQQSHIKEEQSVNVETSDVAVVEEGSPQINQPVTLTVDRPLHVMNAKGEATELQPGIYEIGTIMDLQLGLAKPGQSTMLLHAHRGTHSLSLQRSIALALPSTSDDAHIILLTPDGRRFEARGSVAGIKSSSTEVANRTFR